MEDSNALISDDELLDFLITEIKDYERKPKLLIPNPAQLTLFANVLKYFKTLAKADVLGKVTTDLTPDSPHGYIEVELFNLNIYEEKKKEFIEIINKVDVFSVDGVDEGKIRIEININDCFNHFIGE